MICDYTLNLCEYFCVDNFVCTINLQNMYSIIVNISIYSENVFVYLNVIY